MSKKIIIVIMIVALVLAISGVTVVYLQKKHVAKEKKVESVIETDNLQNNVVDNENIIEDKPEVIDNEVEKNEIVTEIIDAERASEIVDSSDLFGKNYEKAIEILNTMTLDEKVGQMFLARYPESKVNSEIIESKPGGYILFGRDFTNETKESIIEKLNTNQSNSKIKMFLAVDEEGGTVVRVSNHKEFRDSKFPSPQQLLEQGGTEALLSDLTEKTELLKSLGLNMNLAPVVDVTENKESFIYDRTFGKNAEETAECVKLMVKQMRESKLIGSLKHFPGYGDNVDTHTGIAIDEREYVSFQENDFKPFVSGIQEGVPTILCNHNIVKCMDDQVPASLSDNVHRILREDLKFSGLIITDDLAMDAVKSYVQDGQAAVRAVKAGNDLIISSDFVNQKREVLDAVINKEISEDIINRAVIRILACKIEYGI